jgi:hypothetical protein
MNQPRIPELSETDIPWDLEPVRRAETVDLLSLTYEEVVEYARQLQIETADLRLLLHESLAVLARTNVRSDQYQARMLTLVAELRALQKENRSLGAQLRVLLDEAA